MKFDVCLIDTFTSIPFHGNPTAVCHSREELNEGNMQSIAKELNCPVTAFIKNKKARPHDYDIRYFTPSTEIPACGHATLAAAKFLSQHTENSDSITFHTINNIAIRTAPEAEKIMMTYPAYQMENFIVGEEMMDALGVKSFSMAGYSKDLETLFIELDSPDILRTIQPDYRKLTWSSDRIKEVVITTASDNQAYDYLLRSFCPWIGIDEDPVTGSVHSVLANFWKERSGKAHMKAYQASKRGGELFIRAFDDKVEIGGQAVIILTGEICF